jgi:hypothetical protein
LRAIPFLRRGPTRDSVRPGATFQRRAGARGTDTATVLDVASDQMGIPHVRYRLSIERAQCRRFDAGLRVIALDSFLRHFPKQA